MNAKSLIVNIITFSRVPFILAWLVLALLHELRGWCWASFVALAFMALSALTDAFDGALARRWKVVSALGKMSDPLMDKVFYVITFPALTWIIQHQGYETHSIIMLIFTISYILRDLWVTFIRSVGSLYGADCAAMMLGKVRTALSFPVAGFIYLEIMSHDFSLGDSLARGVLCLCYAAEAIMIAINFISFVSYTRAYMPFLKKALERK